MQWSLQGVLSQYLWLITFSHVSPLVQFTHLYHNHQHLSKSLTPEWVVKAGVNYYRQIMTEHADFVTTINSLNTISYLCTIIRTIHVHPPVILLHLVNGHTFELCLIHQLDSLDNPFCIFFCLICLRFESEVDLIEVWDLKRRPFFRQRRIWSPIFGYQCLVTSIQHFCK